VRNLRIAANIRTAAAEFNAKRALVIIGASHKPFLDAYLQAMMDVVVADAESVLGR
jgi:pheromone shutdown protein TraB